LTINEVKFQQFKKLKEKIFLFFFELSVMFIRSVKTVFHLVC